MSYRDAQSALEALYEVATTQGGYFTAKQAANRTCRSPVAVHTRRSSGRRSVSGTEMGGLEHRRMSCARRPRAR